MLKVGLGNDQLTINVPFTSDTVSQPNRVWYLNFGTQFTRSIPGLNTN